MRWLVTGQEGFIGGRLYSRLIQNRHEVTSPGYERRIPRANQPDVIAHVGAIAGIQQSLSDPKVVFEMNTRDTQRYLSIARAQQCPMVFASSAAAANPTNPYAASKAAAEAWCQAYRHSYGLTVSILRFGNVYGPGSAHKSSVVAKMCTDAIRKGEITIHGDGSQLRDFVYVEDVVDAILRYRDGLWSVRTGDLNTVARVAEIIAALSGAKIVHGDRSPLDSDRPTDDAPPALIDHHYTALEDGIRDTWKWFSWALAAE